MANRRFTHRLWLVVTPDVQSPILPSKSFGVDVALAMEDLDQMSAQDFIKRIVTPATYQLLDFHLQRRRAKETADV